MQFDTPEEPTEAQKERAVDLLFEMNRGIESVGTIERDNLLEGYTVTLYCDGFTQISGSIAHDSGLQYWPYYATSVSSSEMAVTVVITRWPDV